LDGIPPVRTLVLALLMSLLACATAPPPGPPCQLDDISPIDGAVLRMLTPNAHIQLVDGRPPVFPWWARPKLGCDHRAWSLPAGSHTIHTAFKVGSSDWAHLELSIAVEAGREYAIQCRESGFREIRCAVRDAATGDSVTDIQRSGNDWEAFADISRAYAACGDEVGRANLDSLRSSGRIPDTQEYTEIGECEAFLDLR
jgi:hypothetical protein